MKYHYLCDKNHPHLIKIMSKLTQKQIGKVWLLFYLRLLKTIKRKHVIKDQFVSTNFYIFFFQI